MEAINISVFNLVGSSFCTDADDGQKVHEMVSKALKENKKVALSFLNIEMLTTAFLNTAVGQLYNSFSDKAIKQNLSVKDISNSGAVALKRVVDTAKLFYKNPDAMQNSINEILEG